MFILIINRHLILFFKRMDLCQSIIETFKETFIQLLNYINSFTTSLQLLWVTLWNSTGLLHTTSELTSNYIVETQKQWGMVIKTYLFWIRIKTYLFWAIIPQNVKDCPYLLSFKVNIRICSLCKCFLKHAGFI